MSLKLTIKNLTKFLILHSGCIDEPPFLKFTKFSILSEFVINHFLEYLIYISQTTPLLKQMTEETDLCKNEYFSCMIVVALDQNVKTYPNHSMQILVNFQNGGTSFDLCLLDTVDWIVLKPLVVWFTDILAYLWLQIKLWDC